MLSQQDIKQIAQKGITPEQIENQLNEFKTGFPFLRLEAAAGIGHGIIAPNADERKSFEAVWNAYKAEGNRIVKFVPASGAASRMFKNMFAFVDADYDTPTTDFDISTISRSSPSMMHSMPFARRMKARESRRLWQMVIIKL